MTNQKNSLKSPRDRFFDGVAFLISAVFSPYLVSVFFILVISFIYADNLKQFLPWIIISFFFIGVIPAGYIFWLLENKKVSDLHLSNHDHRKKPFLVGAISSLMGMIILYFMHAATPILAVATAYAVNAALLFLVTLYWKISIHSALFAASVFIIVTLFGSSFWPLFLFWLPLSWSRVHRKKHTPDQVLFGAIIAILVTAIVLRFFGYKIGE